LSNLATSRFQCFEAIIGIALALALTAGLFAAAALDLQRSFETDGAALALPFRDASPREPIRAAVPGAAWSGSPAPSPSEASRVHVSDISIDDEE
jgi:hypothetical protein